MVDHGLTKEVVLCPMMKTITTEGIATLFFYKVFLHFGLYDNVMSDRGPPICIGICQRTEKLLKYDLSLFTAYHLQSDGKMEQVNQEIETYLRIFCRNNSTLWTESIFHAEFIHNHHPYLVTS